MDETDCSRLARNPPRMMPSAALVNLKAGPHGFNPSFRIPFPDRESLFQTLSNSDQFQDIPDCKCVTHEWVLKELTLSSFVRYFPQGMQRHLFCSESLA
jgi:hypothetical protein